MGELPFQFTIHELSSTLIVKTRIDILEIKKRQKKWRLGNLLDKPDMAEIFDLILLFVLESKNYLRKSTGQFLIFFLNTGDDSEVRENLGDRRVRVPGSAHSETFTGKDGLRQRNPRTGSETLHQATRYVIKSLLQIFYITEKGQKM